MTGESRRKGRGPLAALVNNVAIGLDKPLRDTTDDGWKRDLNLRSAFQCGGEAIFGPGEGRGCRRCLTTLRSLFSVPRRSAWTDEFARLAVRRDLSRA